MAIGSESIGEDEGVAAVVLGAAQRVTVAESVDLLGVDGEDGQATSEKGFDHGPVRLFDGDGKVVGLAFGQAHKPGDGFGETFPTVSKAALSDELALGIENTGLMKPAAKIDANEKLEVVWLHESLPTTSACDVSSAPVPALEAQLPTGCFITQESPARTSIPGARGAGRSLALPANCWTVERVVQGR